MTTRSIFARAVASAIAVVLAASGIAVTSTDTAVAYTPPALKVAVVRSSVTYSWTQRHAAYSGYGIYQKQDAMYNYLKNAGWNVTQIGDSTLSDLTALKQYDVVVMPWVFAMDTTPSKTLLRYTNEGGALVSFFGPRVAPQYEVNRADRYEALPEHWARVYQHEGWEWGPLSEVWQSFFIDDIGAIGFTASPKSHPVLDGAKKILAARGQSTADMSIRRPSDAKTWIELVRNVRNNGNVKQFLTWTFPSTFRNPANGKPYSGTFPAASAAEYGRGRMIDFFFAPTDFLSNYQPPSISPPLSERTYGGAKTGQVMGAYLESAITWAAQDDGVTGTITRGGLTYATVNVYQDGIYASQYLTAGGNSMLGGTLRFKVYDPAGRLVYNSQRYNMGIEPGESRRYSHTYRVPRLADGLYRVETEYQFSHTTGYTSTMKSTVSVRRGQGVNIATVPVGTGSPGVSGVSASANPVSPNGDGMMDSTYLRFTLARPALVTVDILDGAGKVLARPMNNVFRAQGSQGLNYAPTVGDGRYTYRVTARNTYGSSSSSTVLYVSRKVTKLASLSGAPRLSSVGPTVNPFTPNGDGVSDATYFKFTLSAPAYVSVRVYDWRGEVRTVLDDLKLSSGTHSARWIGNNNAGSGLPSGTYAYHVFAHTGGTSPATSLAQGTVRFVR